MGTPVWPEVVPPTAIVAANIKVTEILNKAQFPGPLGKSMEHSLAPVATHTKIPLWQMNIKQIAENI